MPRIIGNTDSLISRVKLIAKSREEEILQETEEKAKQIRNQAKEKADRRREEILRDAKKKAKEKSSRKAVVTSRHLKEEYLQTREEYLEKVWNHARKKLESLPGREEEYQRVLNQLALLAADLLQSETIVLAAEAKGQKLLTDEILNDWSQQISKKLDKEIRLERAKKPLDTWGGLKAWEKNGRRQMDATFKIRLEIAKSEIREQVFERLNHE